MKKKWICVLTAVMMAAAAMPAGTVCAEPNNGALVTASVEPRYSYGYKPTNELTISGTTATCYSEARGMNATRIEMTHYLEKKTLLWWNTVADWTKQTNTSQTLTITTGRTGLESGTYRLRTVVTYYCGSETEEIEITSDSQKVS